MGRCVRACALLTMALWLLAVALTPPFTLAQRRGPGEETHTVEYEHRLTAIEQKLDDLVSDEKDAKARDWGLIAGFVLLLGEAGIRLLVRRRDSKP